MKKIVFLFAAVTLFACKSNHEKEETPEAIDTTEVVEKNDTEAINTEIPDPEEEGEVMLLGKIDRTGLQTEAFNDWFQENRNAHVLDSAAVNLMKPFLNDISIKVFMGTWCEDSQREVPALFKILDAAAFDDEQVEMIAMSHDKDTPQGFEEGHEVEYVPTIIFMKEGKEMNRIVEYAQETLELDMLRILKGAPYTHAYAE
ncbi:MAG: thioredoxin family protein [Bacteroidota bacterium]